MKANAFDYGFTVHNLQFLSTSVREGFEDTSTRRERERKISLGRVQQGYKCLKLSICTVNVAGDFITCCIWASTPLSSVSMRLPASISRKRTNPNDTLFPRHHESCSPYAGISASDFTPSPGSAVET